jgi:formimidoylglutamate deiminase
VNTCGIIEAVEKQAPVDNKVINVPGFALPGFANLHSHAFQRAMAGRTEYTSDAVTNDTFWTWRQFMYDFVMRLTPEQYGTIGAFVYLEMLKAGFTLVGEFHYVHHSPDGTRYTNRSEMAERLIMAANRTGISLRMLPVLYAHAGIGLPPTDEQRRFAYTDTDEFLSLVDLIRTKTKHDASIETGVGIHSLRAVNPRELSIVVADARKDDPNIRFHIHVAEQPREVEEIQQGLGARPVEWMLKNMDLDQHWTLIHSTHINDYECHRLAASDAVVGLCPMTEATLGDGIFPLVDFHHNGGRWGIGTDSHYTTDIAQELRTLECGQRLGLQKRNALAAPDSDLTSHSGRRLFDLALAGGHRSVGFETGQLTPGKRADLIVLDHDDPCLIGHGPDTVLDAWILSGSTNPVRDVMVAGDWIVQGGRHPLEEKITEEYRSTMLELHS